MYKLISLLIIFAPTNMAVAETKPFTIERSEVITVTSQDMTREYRIFIKKPRSYTSDQDRHYPMIFLNDGHYSFPLVSSITRQMSGGGVIEEPIIVGISYDKKVSWQIARTRDYTPTKSLNEENRHSDESRKHSGGANDYLLFIEKELMPLLRKLYRIDTQREVYAGHSFGGLFGAYILKTNPQTFDYYILSDPSIWYHNKSILDIKQNTKASKRIDVLIFSQDEKTKKNCIICMAENAKSFSVDLKASLPAASIEHVILKDEIHETMFQASISRGLRRFLAK